MSVIASQITWHMKNQENIKMHEKRQSTDANPEIRKMLELYDKAAIKQML